MKRLWPHIATFAFLVAGGASASAGVLDYTESFTGSGTFNTTAFHDDLVILSITADTSHITSTGQSPNIWLLSGPFTVTVNGLGSTLFTSTGGVVVNNGQGSVFAGEIGVSTDPNSPAFLGIFNPAFQTYDLSSTFGPVMGTGTFGAGGTTSSGSLLLSSIGTVTFEVTTPSSAIPEPSTWATMRLGFVGLGYMAYRTSNKNVAAKV
jgi:hypothetical protein